MNYEQARNISYRLSENITKNHPCRRGKGRCCEYGTSITKDDANIIIEAVQKGKISQDVVNQAVMNAKKPDRYSCVFLSKGKTCTIYEYRPVICALTGTGGALSELHRSETEPLEMLYRKTGESSEVPFSTLVSTMCHECHSKFIKEGVSVPIEDVILHSNIFYFLSMNASIYISA